MLIPEHDLTPAAVDVIEALMHTAAEQGQSFELDDETLYEFACGALSYHGRGLILAELVTSNSARQRLLEIHKELAQLHSQPLGAVAAGEKRSPVLELVLESVKDSFATFSSLFKPKSIDDNFAFSIVRDGHVPPLEDRWDEFNLATRSIGDAVKAFLRQPGVATVRGGAADGIDVLLSEGVVARLVVEVDEAGDLSARAGFSGPDNASAPKIENQLVHLCLLEPGSTGMPIAKAHVQNGTCVFTREGFTRDFGLSAAEAIPSIFGLRLDSEPAATRTRNRLYAWVEGIPGEDDPQVPVEIHGDPARVEGEHLMVTLSVAWRRGWDMEGRLLDISVVTLAGEQSLGSWPLAPFVEGPILLKIPLPGIEDCEVPTGSLLRARIVLPRSSI